MIEFVLYDKADAFKQILTPRLSHTELLWNAVSFWELTFDSDDRAAGALAGGDRVAVLWDGVEVDRGPWVNRSGVDPYGDLVLRCESDWRLFERLRAWPNPAAVITAQTDEFKRYSGTTEDVVKAACNDVSSRLSLGWTVPPSTNLGSTQRVEARFDTLADLFTPLVTADRLMWSLVGGAVEVSEGALFPRVLTPETGVLGDVAWSEDAPTVTRVVVGGDGEGASRTFREYVNSGREATWGVAESFVDARLAEGVTDLSPDASAALADGAGRVSIRSELNETSWFRFGEYGVGDRVHVQAGPVDQEEVIRSVVIDSDPDGGLVVVPSVGDLPVSADSVLGGQVAALAKGVRSQGRR